MQVPHGYRTKRTFLRRALPVLWLLCAGCGAALQGGVPNVHDVVHPPEQQAFVYDGHVKTTSSWLDHSLETAAFTNAITITVDCDDPDAVTKAQTILATDTRAVIWFAPMFAYGGEGYELRANASDCWQRERDLVRNFRARSIAVWLLDEPADVAWSFWVEGGTRYDPNRYNGILATGAAMVRADFPGLLVGYNFGSLPPTAAVAGSIDVVGIETYGADWQAKLQTLESLTPNFIWLMPPAFVDGDPTTADPILAQRVRDQWAWSEHDTRVTGWYWFLWCCDDTTTGSKSFYTISGGRLPLTAQAIADVGAAIVGRR